MNRYAACPDVCLRVCMRASASPCRSCVQLQVGTASTTKKAITNARDATQVIAAAAEASAALHTHGGTATSQRAVKRRRTAREESAGAGARKAEAAEAVACGRGGAAGVSDELAACALSLLRVCVSKCGAAMEAEKLEGIAQALCRLLLTHYNSSVSIAHSGSSSMVSPSLRARTRANTHTHTHTQHI